MLCCVQVRGYVILEMLGKGAYGAVYKARRAHGDLLVALKEIPLSDIGIFGATKAERESGVSNMNKEVAIISSLCHPNIVQVWDWHKTQPVPHQHCIGVGLTQTTLPIYLQNGCRMFYMGLGQNVSKDGTWDIHLGAYVFRQLGRQAQRRGRDLDNLGWPARPHCPPRMTSQTALPT